MPFKIVDAPKPSFSFVDVPGSKPVDATPEELHAAFSRGVLDPTHEQAQKIRDFDNARKSNPFNGLIPGLVTGGLTLAKEAFGAGSESLREGFTNPRGAAARQGASVVEGAARGTQDLLAIGQNAISGRFLDPLTALTSKESKTTLSDVASEYRQAYPTAMSKLSSLLPWNVPSTIARTVAPEETARVAQMSMTDERQRRGARAGLSDGSSPSLTKQMVSSVSPTVADSLPDPLPKTSDFLGEFLDPTVILPFLKPLVGAKVLSNFEKAATMAEKIRTLQPALTAAERRAARLESTAAKAAGTAREANITAAHQKSVSDLASLRQVESALGVEFSDVVSRAPKTSAVQKAVGATGAAIEAGGLALGGSSDKVNKFFNVVSPIAGAATFLGGGGLPGVGGILAADRFARRAVKWSKQVSEAGTALKSIAGADWNSYVRVAEQISKDASAPAWVKKVASSRAGHATESAVRHGARFGTAVAEGAAIGYGAAALDPFTSGEERWGAAGGGMLAGGAGAALQPVLNPRASTPAQLANDLTKTWKESVDSGLDPIKAAQVGDDTMLFSHYMQHIFRGTMPERDGSRDLKVQLASDEQWRSIPGVAEGGVAMFDQTLNKIVINVDRADKNRLWHEAGHALFESAAANRPDIKSFFDTIANEYKSTTPPKSNIPGLPGSENPFYREAESQYARLLAGPTASMDVVAQIIEAGRAEALQRHSDPDVWIIGELLSEGAARSFGGKNPLDVARGNPGTGKTAIPTFFTDSVAKAMDDPRVTKYLQGGVKDVGAFRPGVDNAKEPSSVVPEAQFGRHPAVQMRNLPDGSVGNDFLTVVDAAGNPAVLNPASPGQLPPGSRVLARPPSSVRRTAKSRAKEVETLYPKDAEPGTELGGDQTVRARRTVSGLIQRVGKKLGESFYRTQTFGQHSKDFARAVEAAIDSGQTIRSWYQKIGDTPRWEKSVRRKLGNIEAGIVDLVPTHFLISKPNNILVNGYSLSAFRRKAEAWSTRDGDFSLGIWNGDINAFEADAKTYLKNHAEGRPGAEGLGENKKNVINAFLLGQAPRDFSDSNPLRAKIPSADKMGVIRSLRLDRLETLDTLDTGFNTPNYRSQVHNLSVRAPEPTPDNILDISFKSRGMPQTPLSRFSPAVARKTASDGGLQLQTKKKLPHVVGPGPIRLIHFTSAELKTLSPKYFGKGSATPTDLRGENKSYAFVEGSKLSGDLEILAHKDIYTASIDGSAIYDLRDTDPLDYWRVNRAEADDNLVSKGYAGVLTRAGDGRDVVILFKPIKVDFAGHGFGGARAVAPWSNATVNSFARKIHEITISDSGATFNPEQNKPLGNTENFAVSIFPERSKLIDGNPTVADIREFVRSNQDLLRIPDISVGTWFNKDQGKTYLDLSVTTPNRGFAVFLGKKFNQIVIFDLKKFEEIPTGGDGTPVKGLQSEALRFETAQDEFLGYERQRRMFGNESEPKQVVPNHTVRGHAEDYAVSRGLEYKPHEVAVPVNEAFARRLADIYEKAKHDPSNPTVKKAYKALAKETIDQYNFLTEQGVVFERWDQPGQPYGSSKEMMEDVRISDHLYFFPTEGGFGSGEAPAGTHPMLAESGLFAKNGEGEKVPLLINDLFRAIHDYFGHAKEGYEFGPRGEYNGYLAHSRMFSDAALPALAAETLAQNSWVNYGPFMRGKDGKLLKKGEPGWLAPADRPFADQKATVMPPEIATRYYSPAVAEKRTRFDDAADILSKQTGLEGNVVEREIGPNSDFAKVPKDSEARAALNISKRPKFGAARRLKKGTRVAVRIDIPAFLNNGVYVATVHEPAKTPSSPVGSPIGYDTMVRLNNPTFFINRDVALIKADITTKFPVATVEGDYLPGKTIPDDIDSWTPVGMDPEDHAYFYDKRTDEPVTSGSEAVSVGNTVFVKDPVYGSRADFLYSPKPKTEPTDLISKGVKLDADISDRDPTAIPLQGTWNEKKGAFNSEKGKIKIKPVSYGLLESPKISDALAAEADPAVAQKILSSIKTKLNTSKLHERVPLEPEEQALYEKLLNTYADPFRDEYVRISGDGDVVAAKGWYKGVTADLLVRIPDSHDRIMFLEFLGGTSPNTSVEQNFLYAVDLYNRWKSGGLDDTLTRHTDLSKKWSTSKFLLQDGSSVEGVVSKKTATGIFVTTAEGEKIRIGVENVLKQIPGTKEIRDVMFDESGKVSREFLSSLRKVITKHYNGGSTGPKKAETTKFLSKLRSGKAKPDEQFMAWLLHEKVLPVRKNGAKYGVHTERVFQILNRSWRDTSEAPKAVNFTENLAGMSTLATIDVWAARFLRRMGYEGRAEGAWRIQPMSEKGVGNADFYFGQDVFGRASDKIFEATGERLDGDDLQAILWFAEKRHWAEQGWSEKEDLGDFRSYLHSMDMDSAGEFDLKTPNLPSTTTDFLGSLRVNVDGATLSPSHKAPIRKKITQVETRIGKIGDGAKTDKKVAKRLKKLENELASLKAELATPYSQKK
jgi:hypothetical protein